MTEYTLTYPDALKLRTGDEVIRKSDNEPLIVISVLAYDADFLRLGHLHPFIKVTAMDRNDILVEVNHTDIK